MYEIFQRLCDEHGVTAYKVCKETGITTASISNWKAGRYKPKQDKLQKIAEYFGVPVEYLITGKEEDSEQKITSLSQSEMVYAGRNENRCWKTTHCANTLKNTRTCEKEL